jgi:hypothetical protein
MVRLGDFEVVVATQHGPLPEFDDPDPAGILEGVKGPAIVKYLQAEANTEFELDFKIHPGDLNKRKCDFVFQTYREDDARYLNGAMALSEKRTLNGWQRTVEGSTSTSAEGPKLQRFRFGSLYLDQTKWCELRPNGSSRVGSLRVEVWEIKTIRQAKGNRRGLPGSLTYSETQLKGRAIDLSLQLGAAESVLGGNFFEAENVGEEPLATIFFKYRSYESLQQLGIICREPTPVPPMDRDIESLNAEELRERLVQTQANHDAQLVQIKKEQVDNNVNTRKRARSPPAERLGDSDTSEQGYLRESFSELRRFLNTVGDESNISPWKLRRRMDSACLKLKVLEDKVLKDDSDDEGSDDEVQAVQGPSKGPAPGQEVLHVSDGE